MDNKLLYISTVSKRLNCSKPTVYKLIYEGKLKGIKIGERGLRITPESLERFLKKSEIQPEDIN